ncbi:hypothetical protein Tco_0710193 [Tanacetum coccineum]
MSTPKFAETRNLVVFLEKPEESNGFEGIIDFLNASSIKYALTVNPTVYKSCIQQFWVTAKTKTVNEECQIQALVDKKKVIITEKSLDDAAGIDVYPLLQFLQRILERMGGVLEETRKKKLMKQGSKPKAVTSAATTTTTTRPKDRGVVVQEQSEFKTTSSPLQASQLPQAKRQ